MINHLAFDIFDSPVGPLTAAISEAGLSLLSFGSVKVDGARRDANALSDTRNQLQEYFAGSRTSFDLTFDLSRTTEFTRRVLEVTASIGFGQLLTYGQVAAAIGSPAASRAVGGALHRNPVAIVVPCHRVVGSTGALTGFGGGLGVKAQLLELERNVLAAPILAAASS